MNSEESEKERFYMRRNIQETTIQLDDARRGITIPHIQTSNDTCTFIMTYA